jgi:hypothetical protein
MKDFVGKEVFQSTYTFDTASQNLAFSLGLAGKPETKKLHQTTQSGSRKFWFSISQKGRRSGSCCIQKMLCLIVWFENPSYMF